MNILDDKQQITCRMTKFTKISSDIDKIHYRVKGESNERKLSFYTYNLVHRLVVSAFVWIIILLVNYATYHYGIIYVGIIISVVLLLLIFTPVKAWVFDFKTEKVLSVFRILGIPISKKEYKKTSFWNSKIEIIFRIYVYEETNFDKKTEQPLEMVKFYDNLLQMEQDVNNAIKHSDFGFVYINFKLLQKAKKHEIEGSLPRGKFSFLKSKKIRTFENPFEIIIKNFFTEKRKAFLDIFTDFFHLSENYLEKKDGPKTHNKLFCSYSKQQNIIV